MGYKIVYSKEKKKKYTLFRMWAFVAAFLLLFALSVRLGWPEGCSLLRSMLVSDSLSHQAEAVVSMLESLAEGEGVSEAVKVFCQELIYGE